MSAFAILTDLIEDPQDNGAYRIARLDGEELVRLWNAVQADADRIATLERELTQWREVAARLGKALNHQDEVWGLYGNESQAARDEFNALAKLFGRRREGMSDKAIAAANRRRQFAIQCLQFWTDEYGRDGDRYAMEQWNAARRNLAQAERWLEAMRNAVVIAEPTTTPP